MENIREIRRHIKSAVSTGQIVRAMKMVSVSKLRRTQRGLAGAKEYMQYCRQLLRDARCAAGNALPQLMCPNNSGSTCYVLITGNRGLCGVYNQELLGFFHDRVAERGEDYTVIVCGKWGIENISGTNIPLSLCFGALSDTPTHAQCAELTRQLVEGYKSGRFSSVALVYQDFVNVLSQKPRVMEFLPAAADSTGETAESDYIFEPAAASVMDLLMEKYLYASMYAVILSAKIGEHSARMTAMSAASDNADEMVSDLTRKLNRARQSAITTEMLELVGGIADRKKD